MSISEQIRAITEGAEPPHANGSIEKIIKAFGKGEDIPNGNGTIAKELKKLIDSGKITLAGASVMYTYILKKIVGQTKYKATDGTYSDTWSEGCTIENTGVDNKISIKNDNTVVATINYEGRGIGDLQDTFEIDSNKKILFTSKIGKLKLASSLTWSLDTTKTNTQVFCARGTDVNPSATKLMCAEIKPNNTGDAEKVAIAKEEVFGVVYLALNKTTASTVDELKTYLDSHDITIYYDKATPGTTTINNINFQCSDVTQIKCDGAGAPTLEFQVD